MKKIVCVGCGLSEDLENPSGSIHPVQLVDLSPIYDTQEGPDKTVEEDLCKRCRGRLRRDFFGEADAELLDMPLMKGVS
jgi:hypothetical protein